MVIIMPPAHDIGDNHKVKLGRMASGLWVSPRASPRAHAATEQLGATMVVPKCCRASWISSLDELGHFNEQIRADYPMAVAFTAKNGPTYVVYNAGQDSVKVTFSDGKVFDVPSGLHSFKK